MIKLFRRLSLCAAAAAVIAAPSALLASDYADRTDWEAGERMSAMSAFVFMDVNESGDYDLPDRAMSAVFVELRKDGELLYRRRSNVDGYVNFYAGVRGEDIVIDEPGVYEVSTAVPPGWRITTGAAPHRLDVYEDPLTRAGLSAKDYVRPIGLAPIRFVRGVYTGSANTLRLLKGGEEVASMAVETGQLFQFDALPRGRYHLTDGAAVRTIDVLDNPIDLGGAVFNDLPDRGATVIDFEDASTNPFMKTKNGYGGLEWLHLNVTRRNFYRGSQGYVNGATSGENIVYNSSGYWGEFYRDEPFDLLRMQLSVAWLAAQGEMVIVEMWRGDEMVRRDAVKLSALGPVEYAPNASGIDRVRLTTRHGWHVVIDDITYRP